MTDTASIETIWRVEHPRLTARLARILGDVGLAEEVVQDAFLQALERWQTEGIPRSPAAWLTQVAKNRAIDLLRRTSMIDVKHRQLAIELELEREPRGRGAVDSEDMDDDLLRLIFICCHPVLPAEQRTALALHLLAGLSTAEIANAFLVPKSTLAQRIVRAKRTLRTAGVPFETPLGTERHQRIATVLEVIYLIFNEGYVPTAGSDWVRADLCYEALRLGRALVALMPNEAEVQGLLTLMELQASRFAARIGTMGESVLLADQDRARWDWSQIRRGLECLEQAMIAACHARAESFDSTDWLAIAAYYQALSAVAPSPIVELNRAVAVGMAFGPAQGLAIADAVEQEPLLKQSHLLPTVRGDLLEKLGRTEEARAEFRRAAGLTSNERERELLAARADQGKT